MNRLYPSLSGPVENRFKNSLHVGFANDGLTKCFGGDANHSLKFKAVTSLRVVRIFDDCFADPIFRLGREFRVKMISNSVENLPFGRTKRVIEFTNLRFVVLIVNFLTCLR